MLSRINIVIMFLSNPGAGSVAGGSSCSDGPVAVVFVVVVVVVVVVDHLFSFLLLILICSVAALVVVFVIIVVLVVIAVVRSNEYFFDPNLWSVFFQTTPINLYVTKPHPPTRFYCPPHFCISKNGGFIPKQALFTDFRSFFARSWVK